MPFLVTIDGHTQRIWGQVVTPNCFDVLAQATKTIVSDPLPIIGATVLLGGLTMLACYLPALRSLRIDPVTMLRTSLAGRIAKMTLSCFHDVGSSC